MASGRWFRGTMSRLNARISSLISCRKVNQGRFSSMVQCTSKLGGVRIVSPSGVLLRRSIAIAEIINADTNDWDYVPTPLDRVELGILIPCRSLLQLLGRDQDPVNAQLTFLALDLPLVDPTDNRSPFLFIQVLPEVPFPELTLIFSGSILIRLLLRLVSNIRQRLTRPGNRICSPSLS